MPTTFNKETKPVTAFSKEVKHSEGQGFDFATFDNAVFDGKPLTTFNKETKPTTSFVKESKP